MSLALTLAGCLLFSGYGLHLLGTESNDLHASVAREMRLLGRSLRVAIENALRDHQLRDIEETLSRLESIEPVVRIVVFDPEGRRIAASAGNRPGASLLQTTEADTEVDLRFLPESEPEQVVLTVPLTADSGEVLGKLVVQRPLDDLQQDLAATRNGVLSTVLLFVLATSLMALSLGTLYIRRPLSRLVEGICRVRRGDLGARLEVRGKDELGVVAEEFNEMLHELEQARTRLEEQEASRRSIERAMQRADKLVTVGQLSAGLAHEIGSPLQILAGRAHSLLAHPDDPVRTRKNALILVEQSERITRIVEQLMHFSRLRQPLVAPTDLRRLASGVVDLLQLEARRCRLVLSLLPGDDLPLLQADSDQLQQMVLNLVTNALAATGEGGRVTVALEAGQMLLPGDVGTCACARLLVEDTGCGIPAEIRERIFEPFFTTRIAERGTGLGLAVVKSIVDAHQGRITLRSEPGQGSCFTVELPLQGPLSGGGS